MGRHHATGRATAAPASGSHDEHHDAHSHGHERVHKRILNARAAQEEIQSHPDKRSVSRFGNLADFVAKADGPLLDDTEIASAVRYNNHRWSGEFSLQIKKLLESPQPDARFDSADVLCIARIQAGAGLDEVDGKLGDRSMAVIANLARPGSTNGFSLRSRNTPKPSEVTLDFYPGELEDQEAWNLRKTAFGRTHDFAKLTAQLPTGSGRIYVRLHGKVVAAADARGGPPLSFRDGAHHANPTKAGHYSLGHGEAHTGSAWANSQIPGGARTRERSDGEWEYEHLPGMWQVATGPNSTLQTPLDKEAFDTNRQRHEELAAVTAREERKGRKMGHSAMLAKPDATNWPWLFNDFGMQAWNLQREAHATQMYLHTTANDEQNHILGVDLALTNSHGCIHIHPSQRDELIRAGYLQPGVKFVVHSYEQHLLPASMRSALHK